MYKLIFYENKLSFKYKINESTYRWKWLADLVGFFTLPFYDSKYQGTGIEITYEIEQL